MDLTVQPTIRIDKKGFKKLLDIFQKKLVAYIMIGSVDRWLEFR